MSPVPPQPTIDFTERLAVIIEGLCAAIEAHCERELAASPFKRLAASPLHRLAAWFAALAADFRAGLLAAPESRCRAPADAALSRAPARPQRRIARGFDWLLRFVPGTEAFRGQMQDWLFGPGMDGDARIMASAPLSNSAPPPEAVDPVRAGPALRAPSAAPPVCGPAAPLAASPVPYSHAGPRRHPPCHKPPFPAGDRTASSTGCAPPPWSPFHRAGHLAVGPGRPIFFQAAERGRLCTSITFRIGNLLGREADASERARRAPANAGHQLSP